jgi:hypothetical protein
MGSGFIRAHRSYTYTLMIWMFCTHYSFTKEVSSGETPVESQEEIPHILLPWFPGTLPDRIEGKPL